MIQAGPIIRFVCEDHPDTVGCDCVQAMIRRHASAAALIEQLKELNLSLQIELRESQREYKRFRGALVEWWGGVKEGDVWPGYTWMHGVLICRGIDPKTLKGEEDGQISMAERCHDCQKKAERIEKLEATLTEITELVRGTKVRSLKLVERIL